MNRIKWSDTEMGEKNNTFYCVLNCTKQLFCDILTCLTEDIYCTHTK